MPLLSLLKSSARDFEKPSQNTFLMWLNQVIDKINDYHRNAELTGTAVYVGPDGFADEQRVRTITAARTLDATDRVVVCNAASAGFSVTLPAAANSTGFEYFIKKSDSSSNAVTVDGNASETIDGQTTWVMRIPRSCLHIYCDGTTWHIIGVVNGAS